MIEDDAIPAETRKLVGGQRWWMAEPDKVADALHNHIQLLQSPNHDRTEFYRRRIELYQGHAGEPGRAYLWKDGDLLSLNVLASIIRTLRAEITANVPRPWIRTDGGSMAMQIKCEGLQQFTDGLLYETGSYETAERWFDHAAVCGTGWIGVVDDPANKRVAVDIWYPWEVVTDDFDAWYGDPSHVARIRYIDRAELAEIYPEHIERIARLPSVSRTAGQITPIPHSDMIKVIEAWHRPSVIGGKDGRHVIAASGLCLLDEPWHDDLPCARLQLEPDLVGVHGISTVEELASIQTQINELLEKIQEGHRKGGHVIIFVPNGANVSTDQITNAMHSIVPYTDGTQAPIIPVVIPTIAKDTYDFLWGLFQKAYEIYGVSTMSAQAQQPAGITAAVAMRTLRRLQSKRFSYIEKAYGRGIRCIAQLGIEAARRLSTSVKGFSVRYSNADAIKRVEWSDVDLDRDAFVVQLFDTSATANDPEGKMQSIQEKLQMGVLDPREAAMYLDDPDLRARPDPWIAAYKLARRQIDSILREGEEGVFVESFQDWEVAFRLGIAEYCRAMTWNDVPTERLDALRAYIEDAQDRIKGLTAPAATPTAPGDMNAALPPAGPAPAEGMMPHDR